MAPRLRFWGILTAVGLAGAAVALLPPSGSGLPMLWVRPGEIETSGPAGILEANEQALQRARYQLRHELRRRNLLALVPVGRAPRVVRADTESVTLDPAATAVAESLWRTIPRNEHAPRVLLVQQLRYFELGIPVDLGPNVCQVTFSDWRGSRAKWIRLTAGRCAFATEFGSPGKEVRAWLDDAGLISFPDENIPQWGRGSVASRNERDPNDWQYPRWGFSYRLDACRGGRADQCSTALGLGRDASAPMGTTPWLEPRRSAAAMVPAALLRDLGPERFGELWRGEETIPVAYERLTGRKFDQWAMEYVQSALGRMEADNRLNLMGWVGWLLWMGLLLGWFAVRVDQRSAT